MKALKFKIQDLPLIDRPREKLLHYGAAHLSNAELIAILIGSGTKQMPVMSICRYLVNAIDDQPEQLNTIGIDQLCHYKSIGAVKAITLIAALELGKRSVHSNQRSLILSSDKAISQLLKPYYQGIKIVHYFLVMMNRRQELLAFSELRTATAALPSVKRIIKYALDTGATHIMISRNDVFLSETHINQEKAFMNQLDAAAGMFQIDMKGLLILEV